ncbi:MAG: protein-L-isoaspartate(D-aspartate) O-methyltransferase [Dehalococcoidia bacterium]
MTDQRIRRERMVARLIEGRGVDDPRVLAAMREVPRHRFVEEALADKAYGDHALPIGQGQTISQPIIVARMAQILELQPGDAVLEIGTGSGYQSAVLSHLVHRVYTIERIAELSQQARATIRSLGIENVHFKVFDGTYGWSEFGPYDAILVTAATPQVPEPLREQLREGGRLVVPVGEAERQVLRLLRRKGASRFVEVDHVPVAFVPLVGRYGFEAQR